MRPTGLKALLATLLVSSAGASDSPLLDRVEGYYVALARNCSSFDGNVEKGCYPPLKDCLLVQRTDEGHAMITVYSVQRLGNTCSVTGQATVKGNQLIFAEKDPRDTISFGQGFAIHFSSSTVTFKYSPAPKAGLTPFCGGQGNLELVRFRLADRVPTNGKKCGD